jgi:hypothetical protein
MEYHRLFRNHKINKTQKLLKKIDHNEYKKDPKDVTRFIKKTEYSKDK